jgi:dolichol-phosphate mannosyltransferase
VNYGVNTLLGVLLSASVNYLISDRLIFASKPESSQELSHSPDLFYPEGLAPGLANIEPDLQPKSADHSLGVFSLVMPAYNEEDTITETVSSIANFLSQQNLHYELLVINDNSKDGTEAVLQSLVSAYPNVRYINSYYPNGFGFAVRCGLESFQGDAVAIVMADGSDSAEDILKYYQKLREGYDCVFGSRFVRGGEVIDYPGHKLLINRLANIFVQVLFAIPYNDTTNAFKAYRREVIEGISPLISHHFNLTVEILLKAIVRQYSFEVVPITWRNRKAGISKLKIREMGSRYLFIVLSVLLERWLSRGDYVRKPTPKASIPSKQ